MLALASAITSNNSKALQAMLGRDADSLLSSGDAAQDKQLRKQFGDDFNQAHQIDVNGNAPACAWATRTGCS